jgi:hypothetical protein
LLVNVSVHPLFCEAGTSSDARSEGIRALDAIALARYREYRLIERSDQVDYLIAISRAHAGWAHRYLAEHAAVVRDPGGQWKRLADLAERWAHGDTLLRAVVPTMWLEFDGIGALSERPPVPSLSACLVPGYRPDAPLAPRADARDMQLIDEILGGLSVPGRNAARQSVGDCISAMPLGGRWIHLSVMLGRDPCAVKLYGMVPRASLMPFLLAVGWRGDTTALGQVVAAGYPSTLVGDDVFIDLNLDSFRDTGRASLGLAVGQQQIFRDGVRDRARTQVLATWTQLNFCSAGRADSARAWLESQAGRDHDFPERFLDLKLVCPPGGRPEAKAYLGEHRR